MKIIEVWQQSAKPLRGGRSGGERREESEENRRRRKRNLAENGSGGVPRLFAIKGSYNQHGCGMAAGNHATSVNINVYMPSRNRQ